MHISEARAALARANSVEEIRRVKEWAAATRDVLRRHRRVFGARVEAEDAELDASELCVDAVRSEGNMLQAMQRTGDRAIDGRPRKLPHGVAVIPTSDELGYKHTQEITRAVQLAVVPQDTVDAYKERQRGKREPSTVAGLIRYWTDKARPSVGDVAAPAGTYHTLVIDPPWPMGRSVRADSPTDGSTLDYPTMSLDEIAELPIASCSADDTQLYLWVTQRFLPDGLKLLKDWGFTYHCLLTWLKPGGFAPFSFTFNTEHVLFGYRGRFELRELGLNIGFSADRTGHSSKPEVFYDLVERVSFEPRLEMFARRERPGWTVWGNEV